MLKDIESRVYISQNGYEYGLCVGKTLARNRQKACFNPKFGCQTMTFVTSDVCQSLVQRCGKVYKIYLNADEIYIFHDDARSVLSYFIQIIGRSIK